ncbi:MAG: hypothetical protein HYT87_08470 [Nitrospirae bacterium]|nr:hypothetical protein [Nitrospirota bacterium]
MAIPHALVRTLAGSVGILGMLLRFHQPALADQLEWSQKAGGAGAVMSASGPYHASDGSSYRLHSAVLQSSTILQASDGGTWRLDSGYLTTFPPRPLVQCRNNADTANCTTWQNDGTLRWRNDRGCTSNCAYSKGALHYYKYVWSANASESEATVNAGSKWSDTALFCPGGACDKTGTTATQAVTENAGWYLHLISYNGGLKGGQLAYGPFGIDQTNPNAPTYAAPSTSDWFRTSFTGTVDDADAGAVQSGPSACEYQVESNNGGWVVTQAYAARSCDAATPSITVGSASNCRDRGKDKCRISVRTTDVAGNTGPAATRLVSADWFITHINNAIGGPVSGFPASATDQGGTYVGTYVGGANAGVPRIYLLNSTATILDTKDLLNADCGGSACGSIVSAPYWTYEGANNYVYVTTANGWVFKFQNTGGVFSGSAVNGFPVQIADECAGGNGREIVTEPVVDDKLVYFGARDNDCTNATTPNTKQFALAYEINPTSYDADQGGDGKPDRIVRVTGCAYDPAFPASATTLKGTPAIKGSWPSSKFMHIGGNCKDKEILRIDVDINNAGCWRNLAGESSVEGWMTGSFGKLFFGTASGTLALHIINNTESTSACPDPPVVSTDPYADLSGFPYSPVGLSAVARGVKANWPSTMDEVYFVDDGGKLYCVCQSTGTGCPAAGGACRKNDGVTDAFPVSLDPGRKMRETLMDNGTLYVVSESGKVFAVEMLYDPSCGTPGPNCDATEPGTQVGAAQGYPFDLGDNTPGLVTSTTGLRNVGGAKLVALGTDAGRTFYLPVVP